MFYDNELLLLQKMLDKSHLQTRIINPNESAKEIFGYNPWRVIEKEVTFYDVFPSIRQNTVYRAVDSFLCCYIFLALPFCNEEKILLIGPYNNVDFTRERVFEQGEKLKISPKMFKELELFYASIPVIKEEKHIYSMVNTFAEYIFSGEENFENIDIEQGGIIDALVSDKTELSEPRDDMFNMDAMKKRYDYENELMKAVSEGNTHKAEMMIMSFSSLSFEDRVTDKLRNIKNYCIVTNTLLRKAAQNGGVHPLYLDSVSSDFARKIENLRSVAQALDFMPYIIKTYCRLVKKHSFSKYSTLVQRVIIKIESDLTDDLSLSALSAICNVTPAYLSSVFKKETGQSLTDYVNKKRIETAKHLLKNTNLQIQTVAQHCGILDLHYFSRMFKKYAGQTPSEYRATPQ
ncbi:MAG: helix-turn-helix domain-containing protein [Clostridia bacterium]|nr:helix-turn-helix domain-containing protein [Clostridia bacterium]